MTSYLPAAGEAIGATTELAAALKPAASVALNTASGTGWTLSGASSFVTDHDNRPAALASKVSNTAAGVADIVSAQTGKPGASYVSNGLWGMSGGLNLGTAAYDAFKGNGPLGPNVMKGASGALNLAAAGLGAVGTKLAGTPAGTAATVASGGTWLAGAGLQAGAQYLSNRPKPEDIEMGVRNQQESV